MKLFYKVEIGCVLCQPLKVGNVSNPKGYEAFEFINEFLVMRIVLSTEK